MRRFLLILVAGPAIAMAGCGAKTTINTEPLTEEQKRQIAIDDKNIADEESQGSAGKSAKKGGKKN